MFDYQMVQVPPNVVVKVGATAGAAADYLQQIVTERSNHGWEFYSVETIGIVEQPGCGCLGALLGMRVHLHQMYVIVFRKLKQKAAPPPPMQMA